MSDCVLAELGLPLSAPGEAGRGRGFESGLCAGALAFTGPAAQDSP